MVDALREARRVLVRRSMLIDLRPVLAPLVVDVMVADQAIWMKEVASYSAPDDVAASEAAVRHAIASEWFAPEKTVRFDFEIFCDTAEELRAYVTTRKLCGEEIPYDALEQRLRHPAGQAPRLRCRRPWMLSTYHKK